MQNQENLHVCIGCMGSNCLQLAAKLQTHMKNVHALGAITMQSRQ